MEASKEGRTLTDFRYACIGYSVFLEKNGQSSDPQKKQAELPFCVGLEVSILESWLIFLLPFFWMLFVFCCVKHPLSKYHAVSGIKLEIFLLLDEQRILT